MQVKIFRREFYFKINQLNSQHAQLFKASVLDQKKKKKQGAPMDRNKKSKHYKINFFFLARTEKEN